MVGVEYVRLRVGGGWLMRWLGVMEVFDCTVYYAEIEGLVLLCALYTHYVISCGISLTKPVC